MELSRRCSFRQLVPGKTVVLSADLDLSDVEFSSIPTFGGTFDGQGYTISGLTITGSGNVRGLFRYLQSGGVVQNVSLEVTIEPTDLQDSLGGLVITTAAVYETALSREVFRVKPILGESSASTNPVERSSTALFPAPSQENTMWAALGAKPGQHTAMCQSRKINTVAVEGEADLEDLDSRPLHSTENLPACTDIGGITGFSTGVFAKL